MLVVRYKDRDILVWVLPSGKRQPFYKSTGRNSGMPGRWLPFDGIWPECPAFPRGWFINDRYAGPIHRYGTEALRMASEAIEASHPPSGSPLATADAVNGFLRLEGCPVKALEWLYG